MDARRVKEMLDSGEIVIRTSARRRKTVSLSRQGGQWVLLTPVKYSPQRRLGQIASLFERLERKGRRVTESDEQLVERCAELTRRYFSDEILPRTVRWVTNQQSRFASCSVETGDIRVSHRLKGVPVWVLDSVLVHELAHLREADHSPQFHALVDVYPRTRDADIFLEGFTFGEAAKWLPTADPAVREDR